MDDKRLIILDTRPKRMDAHSREVLSLQQVTHSDYELTISIESTTERSIEDNNDKTRITFNHYEVLLRYLFLFPTYIYV